jgi:LysM repeat protein
MACGYFKTDENGNVRKSPTISKVIDYIDTQLASNEPVDPFQIQYILMNDGTIGYGNRVSVTMEKMLLQELADLNAIAALYYGSPVPLVRITPYTNQKNGRRTEYDAQISQEAAMSLTKNVAPKLPNTVSPYEFSLNAHEFEAVLRPMVVPYEREELKITKAEQQVIKKLTDQQGKQLDLFEDMDSRLDLEDMQRVEPSSVENQINTFIRDFASVGINVEVVIDPTLEVKGRVINEPGKILTIKLNPTLMTEDTTIHEFSHILVELLGEDHPVVVRAINELKDTNLYKEVKKAYPGIDESTLNKEVLVTAMGLSGAKIVRQNPNLFQRIFNRVVRALSKLFGVEAKPSAVEELTRMLLEKKYNKSDLKGSITFLMADSKNVKSEEDFMKLVDDVRVLTQESIDKLKRAPGGINETDAEAMSLMQKRLDRISDVEGLIEFVNYAANLADKAEKTLDSINQRYNENLPTKERLQLLHDLYKVGEWVNDFYGGRDGKDSIMQKIGYLVSKDINRLKRGLSIEQLETDPKFKSLSVFEKKISDAIFDMSNVEETYRELGIPLMADLLMEYTNDDINDEITKLIDNITNNNRLIAIERDEEYNKIKAQKLDKADEFAALKALNIKQLKNKMITRETLINELKEAQKDKSAFSYLLDPIIYSSQVGLQMFASMLKDKMYQANDVTQDDIYELAEAYKEFQKYKGSGTDPNKFNDDILEEHTYMVYNSEKGKSEKMTLLSFVQEYDVTRYRDAESKMYEDLAKKYNKPDKDDEALQDWLKNKSVVRDYYKEVAKWYAENSTPSKDSQEQYKIYSDKLATARKKLSEEKAKNKDLIDPDRVQYYQQEVSALQSLMGKMYDTVNGQWKISAVRPNDKYKNAKYEALKNNAPAFAYYRAMMNFYYKKQKLLGQSSLPKNSWEKFSYIVPSVRSEGLEKVQKDGAWNAAKDAVKENFQFLSTDVNYGDLINANKETRAKTIPIFYTNPTDSKLVSRDVASTLVLFGGMANMFKSKSEIVGSVMIMRNIIQEREVLETTAGNNPIVHRMSKILKGTKHVVKGKGGNNFKHLDEWIDKIFFGEEELKNALNIFGKEMSANKLANKVASLTALSNLAGNLLQATNQALLDNVRMLEEAHSQQFFNKKNMAWAKGMYHFTTNGGLGSLKDFKTFAPTSKIVQAIRYFDALGEVLGSTKEDKTGPRILKLIQEGPMALQTIAEHETAVTRMLALMDSYKGEDHKVAKGETIKDIALKYKVSIDGIKQWNKLSSDKITEGQTLKIGKLLDAEGNIITKEDGSYANLWDVFIKDEKTGRYSVDPRVVNFDRSRFISKISGINKRTNQVKTKFDDAIIQRRWYGKLIMLFRRYFIPSLRKHYGHNGLRGGIHRDLELGTISEGTMETLWRYMKETWKNYGNGVKVYKMMSDMEKQNMRRSAISIAFWTLCGLIVMALSDDDDEDDSWAESFLIYQALRMQTELTQFVRPIEFLKTANSPTATVRPITKAIELADMIAFKAIPSLFTGDTKGLYYERKSGLHEKGDSKLLAKFEDLVPILGGINKSADPATASKWFDLPATSTK